MYPPTLKLVLFYSQLLLVNGLVWGQLVLGYFFFFSFSFSFFLSFPVVLQKPVALGSPCSLEVHSAGHTASLCPLL